jgi:hypothetical protein
MITRHSGGETVKGGIYWSLNSGEFVSIPPEGGRLPGGPKDRYVKAPLPLVLVVGPLMGLAFAIFLPLSGLLVLIPFLANKVRSAISSGKVGAAQVAGSRLQPGVSYLEPGSTAAPRSGASRSFGAGEESRLIDLAKEIAEKRWQEK